MVLFALIPPLLGMRRLPVIRVRVPPVVGFLIALAIGAVYLVVAQLAFNGGRVLPVALPLTALVLSAIFTLAALLIVEASDKRRIHDLFARFVPEKVVDQVVANADEELRLGGESRDATVLFSDLRGFTTYSETRPPADVIDILNGYLSEMTDAILDAGGTLVAYMGDGIMAVFGAPLDQPDHCDRALRAGARHARPARPLQPRRAARARSRSAWASASTRARSSPATSAPSAAWSTRSIGDITNTASRIEGLTKGTPYGLLMAQSTVDGLAETPGRHRVPRGPRGSAGAATRCDCGACARPSPRTRRPRAARSAARPRATPRPTPPASRAGGAARVRRSRTARPMPVGVRRDGEHAASPRSSASRSSA